MQFGHRMISSRFISDESSTLVRSQAALGPPQWASSQWARKASTPNRPLFRPVWSSIMPVVAYGPRSRARSRAYSDGVLIGKTSFGGSKQAAAPRVIQVGPTAGGAVRDYAENVDRYVGSTGYAACAASSAYSPSTVGFAAPAGFTALVASVRYWTGTGWTSTCSSDVGLQQVTLQVQSSDARAIETSVLVVRKPCGQGSSC